MGSFQKNKNLKKYYSIICFLALFGFFSCSTNPEKRAPSKLEMWMEKNGKIKVLATTPIIEDLARRLGGNEIDVISLIEGDIDPHSYEIVKGDGEKIAYAQIIFANGLSLEHSASMSHQFKAHPNVIFLGDEVLKMHPQEMIFIDKQVDPHIWMDPLLWKACIDPIINGLKEIDRNHNSYYDERATETKLAFDAAHQNIVQIISQIPPERRYLVTSHDAFNYFTRRYLALNHTNWKDHALAIQGLAPDEQISPLEIAAVVNYVFEHKIPVLFPERNLSRDSLTKVIDICRQKGVKVHLAEDVLYGDTMGGNHYFEMLIHNANVMCSNLGGAD